MVVVFRIHSVVPVDSKKTYPFDFARDCKSIKNRGGGTTKKEFLKKSLVFFLQRLNPEIMGLPQAFFRIKCEGFF